MLSVRGLVFQTEQFVALNNWCRGVSRVSTGSCLIAQGACKILLKIKKKNGSAFWVKIWINIHKNSFAECLCLSMAFSIWVLRHRFQMFIHWNLLPTDFCYKRLLSKQHFCSFLSTGERAEIIVCANRWCVTEAADRWGWEELHVRVGVDVCGSVCIPVG